MGTPVVHFERHHSNASPAPASPQEGWAPRLSYRFQTVTRSVDSFARLAAFLRARGRTLARLGVNPTIRDTFYGVGLCVGYYAFYYVVMMTLSSVWLTFGRLMMSTHLTAADLQWRTVVAASAINPVFEEVFVCGYVITALKDRAGVTMAVNVSAGLRVFCHFCQGAVGVVGVAPLALLFAYLFARNGRLWPLIVAHALTDFEGLAAAL